MPPTSTDTGSNQIFRINSVDVRSIIALRLALLRPDEDDESWCRYPGDHGQDSLHLKALHRESGKGVGMVTVTRESRSWGDCHARYRVRGLGVSPTYRRRGLGRSLLAEAVRSTATSGEKVWLSGRTVQTSFYRGSGFEVVSAPYEVHGTGEHADFCL